MTTKAVQSDLDGLREAFAEFRKKGYWARMNQDGGLKAVPEDLIRRHGKWVYWDANETVLAFDPAGNLKAPLHLRHTERDADDIVKTLERFGFPYRKRVGVDYSPNGGCMVFPESRQPIASSGEKAFFVGRRYFMAGGPAHEWYVASANDDAVQLVAKDVDHTWMSMKWAAFWRLLAEEGLKPAFEVAA